MPFIPAETYRRFRPLIAAVQRTLDPALVVASLYWVCRLQGIQFRSNYAVLAVVAALLTAGTFGNMGFYRSWRTGTMSAVLQRILIAWAAAFSIMLLLGYVIKDSAEFSRRLILLWALFTPCLLGMVHAVIRWQLSRLRRSGRNRRKVVFFGANATAARMAQAILEDRAKGMDVLGVFADQAPPEGFPLVWLGRLDDAAASKEVAAADVAYIALPPDPGGPLPQLLEKLQAMSLALYLVPDLFVFGLLETRVEDFNGTPVFALGETRVNQAAGLIKDLVDMVLAFAILLLTSPLLLVISVGVKLSSPGPILFRQPRYGLDGRPIVIFKFRTMRVCEDGGLIVQARPGDARVTRWGRFLRSSSLDELPQFFNVLLGQMSIVGPRPHAITHNETYRHLIFGYMLRHRVKPGITGWAQIHGYRGETENVDKMARRVEYDLYYIRNWSLLLDLQIILHTPWSLIRANNAY